MIVSISITFFSAFTFVRMRTLEAGRSEPARGSPRTSHRFLLPLEDRQLRPRGARVPRDLQAIVARLPRLPAADEGLRQVNLPSNEHDLGLFCRRRRRRQKRRQRQGERGEGAGHLSHHRKPLYHKAPAPARRLPGPGHWKAVGQKSLSGQVGQFGRRAGHRRRPWKIVAIPKKERSSSGISS